MSASCWNSGRFCGPSGSGESWFEPRRGNEARQRLPDCRASRICGVCESLCLGRCRRDDSAVPMPARRATYNSRLTARSRSFEPGLCCPLCCPLGAAWSDISRRLTSAGGGAVKLRSADEISTCVVKFDGKMSETIDESNRLSLNAHGAPARHTVRRLPRPPGGASPHAPRRPARAAPGRKRLDHMDLLRV